MIDFNKLNKKRVIYTIPGMERAQVVKNRVYKTVDDAELLFDVYYPAEFQEGEQRPAVIFVHGLGPVDFTRNLKSSGQYISWGQLTAASGLIAVTFNHRSPNAHISLRDIADEVDALVNYVREHARELRIDQNRLALWACSAGVPLSVRSALLHTPTFMKGFVAYYGPLNLQNLQAEWNMTEDEVHDFSATTYLKEHVERLAPLFIAKAGRDYPVLNASIDQFIQEASAKNVGLDFLIQPSRQHGFDILNPDARSHEIIQRTLAFLKTSLTSPSASLCG